MLSAHGTVTIRPKEVIPIYREEWDARVTDYKYDLVNRDFVSRGGNIYQVKVQRPNEFVPAGIDPDSEIGERYWEIFNKLSPSVTNFLVIVDEDGKPQTLLSGGRIQARFLNIGSLNMGETRLWGGAEPMKGKGLALVNDPGDRKFVVYNDSTHYVEMFQRENEWGLKGIDGNINKPIFSLGRKLDKGVWKDNNVIGPFTIENMWLRGTNLHLSGGQLNYSYDGHQVFVGSHPDMSTGGGVKLGTFMLSGGGYGGISSLKNVALIVSAPNDDNSYAMAVTQGMLKLVGNSSIFHGVFRASMTGSNPGITLGNEHPNVICLHGTGDRKKVSLYAGMQIGKCFFITSEDSQGFDILCSGSERFYRNGKAYLAVQSSGQDTVLVMKVDTYRWTACQLPVNWLGTWNP